MNRARKVSRTEKAPRSPRNPKNAHARGLSLLRGVRARFALARLPRLEVAQTPVTLDIFYHAAHLQRNYYFNNKLKEFYLIIYIYYFRDRVQGLVITPRIGIR